MELNDGFSLFKGCVRDWLTHSGIVHLAMNLEEVEVHLSLVIKMIFPFHQTRSLTKTFVCFFSVNF